MFIQPQQVNARDASRGYEAKFDNLPEAMGYLKALDTLETAMHLDPLVQVATFGPLDGTIDGAVLGQVHAQALSDQGFTSVVNGTNTQGTEWTMHGPAGLVSFSETDKGTSAVIVDGSGFRSVAISSRSNGILYQEY